MKRHDQGTTLQYGFSVTCPFCGHAMRHENAGTPTDNGMRTIAIVRCDDGCRRRFQLTTRLDLFTYSAHSGGAA